VKLGASIQGLSSSYRNWAWGLLRQRRQGRRTLDGAGLGRRGGTKLIAELIRRAELDR
jgi:hypothetical protein